MLFDFEVLHMCAMIALFGAMFVGSNALLRKKFGFAPALITSIVFSLLVLLAAEGFDIKEYSGGTYAILSSIFRIEHLYIILFGLLCLGIAMPVSKVISSQAYRSMYHMLIGTILLLFVAYGEEFTLVVLVVLLVALSLAEYFRLGENNALSRFIEAILSPAFRGDEAMGYLSGFFYLLGVFFVILFLPKPIAMASVSILAFADPSATLIGKNFGKTKWSTNKDKSIEGSIAMLMVSIIVLVMFHLFYGLEISVITIIFVAIAVTLVEALPLRVGDNILIPLLGAMIMAAGSSAQISILWLILLVILGPLVYYMKFLDLSATLVAVFFALVILISSNPVFLVALIDFLILGYLISRFRYDEKKKKKVAEKRAGTRTINPVIANGIAPVFFSLVYNLDYWAAILLFTGAIAGALGDVFATEIGCLTNWAYLPFSGKVHVGERGAISMPGELGSVIGGSLMGLVLAFLFSDYRLVFFSILAGFIGSNIDSMLNAYVPNITRSEVNVLATLVSGIVLLFFY
ncbi:MAG: DUF92 domain-containing protein [Candidatus Thermoplasmatota archaeon]|nr:DUF92 domain-containing protein [Candidatus Thermoplasmatota archaeon]